MSDYSKVRADLVRRREELVRRLEKLKSDIRRTNNPDFAEQATEREEDEVLDALDDASRRELAAIDRAIGRIDGGDYGSCSVCGQEIAAGRLEILPFSDRCVDCAD